MAISFHSNRILINDTVVWYFQYIEIQDYSSKIAKSTKLLYRYALAAIFIRKFWALLGRKYGNEITIKNTYGAKYQYQAFKKGLWKYEVVLAKKE